MKFQVFKNGKIDENFKLVGAYIFGTDGIAVRQAEITFKSGTIECRKANLGTSGLALLWEIEGFGKTLLPTTCLPEREQPYNLNVEIARAKLMQIITMREEWSFFSDSETSSLEAQNFFIEAIQNISDPPKASKFADKALHIASVYAEKLTLEYANQLVNTRSKDRGFGRGYLGCAIEPDQINNPEQIEKLPKAFGVVNININWAKIEAEKDVFDFSKIDACIETVSKKKLAIAAGPLLCFSKEYVPAWLSAKDGFEKIREAAYQFILKVVSRYAAVIRPWRIISGLNYQNCFGFNFEQILEMTRAANMAAKAANPRSIKIIEIVNPWGEYYALAREAIPPFVYADMLIQSGINFDAFGLQLQFGKDQDGMHIRDMMQISAMLDRFSLSGKPLCITHLEVPSKIKESDSSQAGIWHNQWDQKLQKEWLEQFYTIALSKSFVDTIIYSHLVDTNDSIIPNSGLLTEKLEEKPSFLALKKMHDIIFSKPNNTKKNE